MMWCWRAVQMATSVRPRRPRHPPPLRSAWLVDVDCGATISVRGDGIVSHLKRFQLRKELQI